MIATLPGLSGNTLHGWIAAVGVLRLADEIGHTLHLSWADDGTPMFTGLPEDLPLLEMLKQAARWWAETGARTPSNRVVAEGTNNSGRAALADDPAVFGAMLSMFPCVTPEFDRKRSVVGAPGWLSHASMLGAAFDAATILADTKADASAWGCVMGVRGLLSAARWKAVSGSRRLPNAVGACFGGLIPVPSRAAGSFGTITAFDKKKGGYSTEPSHEVAPDLTFLVAFGSVSVLMLGGRMPGEHLAAKSARWPMWSQPLTLRSINYLVWHPALDASPDTRAMKAIRVLCGGHSEPVLWAKLSNGRMRPCADPRIESRKK